MKYAFNPVFVPYYLVQSPFHASKWLMPTWPATANEQLRPFLSSLVAR